MSTSTFFTQEGIPTHARVPFIDISLYIFMHLFVCSTLSVESKCHDKPFVTAATTLSYRRQLPDRKTSTMMKTKSRGTTDRNDAVEAKFWASWDVAGAMMLASLHDLHMKDLPINQKVKRLSTATFWRFAEVGRRWVLNSSVLSVFEQKNTVEQRKFAVLHQMRYRPVALRSIDYSTHW